MGHRHDAHGEPVLRRNRRVKVLVGARGGWIKALARSGQSQRRCHSAGALLARPRCGLASWLGLYFHTLTGFGSVGALTAGDTCMSVPVFLGKTLLTEALCRPSGSLGNVMVDTRLAPCPNGWRRGYVDKASCQNCRCARAKTASPIGDHPCKDQSSGPSQ